MRTIRAAGWVAAAVRSLVRRPSRRRQPARATSPTRRQKGDRAAVQKLIQQKADVNAPQVDGATALHWAVYREDAELVDMLIRAGANVKAANREGVTPLLDGGALRQRRR